MSEKRRSSISDTKEKPGIKEKLNTKEQIAEQFRMEELELLRVLAEGTAAATGDEFFRSLVLHLAKALKVRSAFVAEFTDVKTRVRTMAYWRDDNFVDNVEFNIAGTPCEDVTKGNICHYPENVQKLFPNDAALGRLGIVSYLGVPLVDDEGNVLGHLAVFDTKPMPKEPRAASIFRIFAARARAELERKRAEKEINKLNIVNSYLQEEIKYNHNFEEIVGDSNLVRKIFDKMEQVASTDATVLIIGETGTGKELIARAIHSRSKRKNKPLIKVNCAALSPTLIESEFFGHEKGSFTGAIAQRLGRFELANGGTIFLDEIGDIPLDMQAKLLRVLQEQEFERVGGSKTLKVDARVIAATNRDLGKAAAEERFRPDLYYRLNVFPINLPPLRERKQDIPHLVRHFVDKHMRNIGKEIKSISAQTLARFSAYPWPGNIRELENIVERAVILTKGAILDIDDDLIPFVSNGSKKNLINATSNRMEDIEREHITNILEQVNWVIEGAKGAARILDINPNTLRSRMQKLGIKRNGADIL